MRFSICVKGSPSDSLFENYMGSWWIPGFDLVGYFYAFREELNWKTTKFFSLLEIRETDSSFVKS